MWKEKRKLKYACIATLVILLMMMQTVSGQFIHALSSTSDDSNMNKFNPEIYLKKDNNGQALKNNDVVNLGDTLYLQLQFNIQQTDIENIDINKKYTITIPDYLQIKDSVTVNVELESGLGPLGILTLEKEINDAKVQPFFSMIKM